MVRIGSCRGQPILHDFANSRADDVHFRCCESIAPSEIARGASLPDVTLDVRQGVINAIQPARAFRSSAVTAGLLDQRQNFGCREVAGVNLLVCRSKKYCPPFIGPSVALLPRPDDQFLLWREVFPSVSSIIAAELAKSQALPTLVRQPRRSILVPVEKLPG